MKVTFKTILVTAITTISAFGSVAYLSCNTDRCKTILCANRGICNGGSCTCPSGYEGTNCETETRKKFTGNWSVFEKGSNSLAAQYPITIENGESITFVQIKNFNNYFSTPIRAYVDKDKLIIPVQRMQGKVFYGEGIIKSNTTYGQYGGITMRYLVQDTITNIKDDYGYESAINFSDPSSWNK
ncbi:MAG: hypothetical protein H7257_05855 [Taibaiella sp.]|nr:hypothetical protein [Taibaiella sp.]